MKLVALLLFLALSSCSNITVVPTGSTDPNGKTYSPVPASDVGVYESTAPFTPYQEIGLITLTGSTVDLPYIYKKLRTAAAERGAEAVIGLKIDASVHHEPRMQTTTSCDGNGVCTSNTITIWDEVSTFTATGSMIRRK